MKCTGECCKSFPLSNTDRFFTSRDDFTDRPDLLALFDVERVVPAEHHVPEYAIFTCRAWDASTRRCTAYADRPQLCRDYPQNPDGCRFCGATSHEDASS